MLIFNQQFRISLLGFSFRSTLQYKSTDQRYSTKVLLWLNSRVFCAHSRALIRDSLCSLGNSFRRLARVNLSTMLRIERIETTKYSKTEAARRKGGCNGAAVAWDRTIADNGIASDFCMPISRPALCRRQCSNNYAKRRPFIRPFERIQTGLSVSIIVARCK